MFFLLPIFFSSLSLTFRFLKCTLLCLSLSTKVGLEKPEFLLGWDFVRRTSTDACWQQLEEAWKSAKKQVLKDLDVSQVPLFNCSLCSCYLEYDAWTIRISISITWELARRENLRPQVDLLSENLHFTIARTFIYTFWCLRHWSLLSPAPDLSRSLFQYLWSRGNNFCFTSLFWWLITRTCKSAMFGTWYTWQLPSHTQTHIQTGAWNKTARNNEWVKSEGKWERWNKVLVIGIIVGILRNLSLIYDDCVLIM